MNRLYLQRERPQGSCEDGKAVNVLCNIDYDHWR